MSDFQATADRFEIEALRGEFTDAVMMNDHDRLASLFTHDGVWRMPNIPVELAGREEIRAWGERVPDLVDYLVQNTHPGTIALDGDTASGRAYMSELGRTRDGRSGLNYAIYHDRYQRTGDGWKFTERVYEVRYLDTTPLAGSAPHAAGAPANPVGCVTEARGGTPVAEASGPGRQPDPSSQPTPYACIPPPPAMPRRPPRAARQHPSTTTNERQFDDQG